MTSFVERLRARERVVGTMLFEYTRPSIIERLRATDPDFLAVDLEHASLSRAEVGQALAAVRLAGVFPMARVLRPTAHDVNIALDAGARGVLVPYVETVAAAREVLAAARLRPLKGAAIDHVVQTGAPGTASARAAWDRNRDTIVIIGIESVAAVDNLRDLLDTGVDGVFVGVWDLTYSMGRPGELDHREVKQVFRHVLKLCDERGLVAAIWPLPVSRARYWAAHGMSMILASSDVDVLVAGLAASFQALRAAPRAARPIRRRTR